MSETARSTALGADPAAGRAPGTGVRGEGAGPLARGGMPVGPLRSVTALCSRSGRGLVKRLSDRQGVAGGHVPHMCQATDAPYRAPSPTPRGAELPWDAPAKDGVPYLLVETVSHVVT